MLHNQLENELSTLKLKRKPAYDSPVKKYFSEVSKSSAKTYRYSLLKMASYADVSDLDYFNWRKLDADKLLIIRDLLIADGLGPSRVNLILTATKACMKKAASMNIIKFLQYDKVKEVEFLKVTQPSNLRVFSKSLFFEYKKACEDGTLKGERDLMLAYLMINCGLTRSEVIRIKRTHIDFSSSIIVINRASGKQRLISFPRVMHVALNSYLNKMFEENYKGYIFVRFDKYDRPLTKRDSCALQIGLSPGSINYIFKSRADKVGLNAFSGSDLRRAYAISLLQVVGFSTTATMMGVSSFETLENYATLINN